MGDAERTKVVGNHRSPSTGQGHMEDPPRTHRPFRGPPRKMTTICSEDGLSGRALPGVDARVPGGEVSDAGVVGRREKCGPEAGSAAFSASLPPLPSTGGYKEDPLPHWKCIRRTHCPFPGRPRRSRRCRRGEGRTAGMRGGEDDENGDQDDHERCAVLRRLRAKVVCRCKRG